MVMWRRGRAALAVGFLLIAASFLGAREAARDPGEGLLVLASVGGVVVGSALIAEAAGVTPAIVELAGGFLLGLGGAGMVEALEFLGLMGASALMFMAGLEIEMEVLRRKFMSSLTVGLASFAAPFTASTLLLTAMGYEPATSMITATGISTTSVAVVYSIVRGARLPGPGLGSLILASAMVADVASIIAFSALVLTPSMLLAIYLASFLLVPLIFGKLVGAVARSEHELAIKTILAILLAVILFSEIVGFHSILYSFILGLAASAALGEDEELLSKLNAIVFGFLAPAFFVNAGLLLATADPATYILPAILLLAVSYPAKVAGTHTVLNVVTRGGGLPLRLSNVFAARLTVSTIIAYAGLEEGIIPGELAGAIMISALIATLLAGFLSREKVEPEAMEMP